MKPFALIVRRDVGLAFRQGSSSTHAVVFFVLAVTLFPLGVGPEIAVLARISGGVLWVAALLAATISLDRLFQADFEDGSLELLALGPLPLWATVLAKCAAHWLTTGMPLVAASPVLALVLHLEAEGYGTLVAAMALGTPSLSLIGAIGAALTVGLRRGGVLVSLLVLPLYIPVLIFGVGAIDAAVRGAGAGAHLMILAALFLFGLVLGPLAGAAALRLNLE